ncbi:MAG TPA: ribosome maturation factor RimP [Tissierellales bacterium]|nr:ribosome maturation factor RimP [Tissierellales bacterium]
MSRKKILDSANEISTLAAEALGYELVDLEFVKEHSEYFLRIYIDKPGGVNLDDCQKMSEIVSEKLDEVDIIEVSYYLEVSSPGLDRPLKTDKDLNRNIGRDVDISLYSNLNGKKKYSGELIGFNEEYVEIRDDQGIETQLPKEIISLIKLAVKF